MYFLVNKLSLKDDNSLFDIFQKYSQAAEEFMLS
jgi:hypothetical protein